MTDDRLTEQTACPLTGCRPGGAADEPALTFVYRNHRGEVALRRVIPHGIRHDSTPHHPEPQWLLEAWDADRKDLRDFALKDVVAWGDGWPPASAPTEADLARDLAADLEVCDRATPGPWECRHPLGKDRLPVPSPSMVGPGAKSFSGPFPVAHCYGANFADGDFIAEAREGWPAAIRRALAAEAEVNRLRAVIIGLTDRVAAQSDLLSRRVEK